MFRLQRRPIVFFILAVILLSGMPGSASAQEATPNGADEVTILGPDESYAGATRGEWDARWWQWAVSFPQDINPNVDVTGDACGLGQSGPVFFLPGNFTGEPGAMTCIVPEGTAIYVGVGGSECSTVEPPPFFGRDEQELRECAAAGTDGIQEVSASVNGEPIANLDDYRTGSPLFSLTFGEDDIFDVPSGVALSVSDGYNFIVAPPAPGEYLFEFSALFEGEPAPFTGSVLVIVQAPQIIEPQASPESSPEAATPVA